MNHLFRIIPTLVMLFFLCAPCQLTAQIAPNSVPSLNKLLPKALNVLTIGINTNNPPFVIQGGPNEIYGYDISMIDSLCKILKRSCKYKMMKWNDLIPSVMNNSVDLAVSAITITPERAKLVNFSLPYALSYSRVLTLSTTPITSPFTFSQLNGKKIGGLSGSIYANQAAKIGIKNSTMVLYDEYDGAIKALVNKDIDFILLDNPTALYWAANSSGILKVVGEPYVYGYGMGIAVSTQDNNLLPSINNAIIQYQNSPAYQDNFHRFLDSF